MVDRIKIDPYFVTERIVEELKQHFATDIAKRRAEAVKEAFAEQRPAVEAKRQKYLRSTLSEEYVDALIAIAEKMKQHFATDIAKRRAEATGEAFAEQRPAVKAKRQKYSRSTLSEKYADELIAEELDELKTKITSSMNRRIEPTRYMTDTQREQHRLEFNNGRLFYANGSPIWEPILIVIDAITQANGESTLTPYGGVEKVIKHHSFILGHKDPVFSGNVIIGSLEKELNNASGHFKPSLRDMMVAAKYIWENTHDETWVCVDHSKLSDTHHTVYKYRLRDLAEATPETIDSIVPISATDLSTFSSGHAMSRFNGASMKRSIGKGKEYKLAEKTVRDYDTQTDSADISSELYNAAKDVTEKNSVPFKNNLSPIAHFVTLHGIFSAKQQAKEAALREAQVRAEVHKENLDPQTLSHCVAAEKSNDIDAAVASSVRTRAPLSALPPHMLNRSGFFTPSASTDSLNSSVDSYYTETYAGDDENVPSLVSSKSSSGSSE